MSLLNSRLSTTFIIPNEYLGSLYEKVCDRRATIAENILVSLDQLKPGWVKNRRLTIEPKLDYILLHHTLYEVKQAIVSQDSVRAEKALDVWEDNENVPRAFIETIVGSVCVVQAETCRATEDDRFMSTPYAITQGTLSSDPPITANFLNQALRHVFDANLQHYIHMGLGVIILMKQRAASATTNSYSLTAFPGTVYTDWTPDSIRLGETILHEASHSWLNESLAAFQDELPVEPTWFSVWKEVQRPAYGIIHAALAFSILTRYFRYFIENPVTDTRTKQYCQVRADIELERLISMKKSIEEASSLLRTESIKQMILGELECALHL